MAPLIVTRYRCEPIAWSEAYCVGQVSIVNVGAERSARQGGAILGQQGWVDSTVCGRPSGVVAAEKEKIYIW